MTKCELIDLCKKGNEQALSLLYKTYASKMKKICCQYVSDKQTVNDLLHDGFIIIFTSINTLRSPEKLESWMGKIMKNISLRYLEKRRSLTEDPLDNIEEFEEPSCLSYPNNFPSYVMMLKMIESLPEGYRKIFKLAVLEGLSHKEIGVLLNIAPHSSSSQLSRAKKLLRKLLSEYRIIAGLFILSSIIYLRHLRHTPKEIAGISQKAVIHPEEKKVPKNISLKKPVNFIHTSAYQDGHYGCIENEMDKQDIIYQDNTTERKDSVFNHTITKNVKIKKDKELHRSTTHQHLFNDKKNWSLALSYSGVKKQTNTHKTIIPGDTSSENPEEMKKKSYHHIPITLSLSLCRKIGKDWDIETGFQYTYLRSDFTTITSSYWKEIQKINYIGIPLKGAFNIWNRQKFSFYISAGVTLDIPIKATSENFGSDESGKIIFNKKTIYPSLQWSTNLGISARYQITPSFGIYAEPNLRYYINKGNCLRTIRTEKPFNTDLSIGVRLSW